MCVCLRQDLLGWHCKRPSHYKCNNSNVPTQCPPNMLPIREIFQKTNWRQHEGIAGSTTRHWGSECSLAVGNLFKLCTSMEWKSVQIRNWLIRLLWLHSPRNTTFSSIQQSDVHIRIWNHRNRGNLCFCAELLLNILFYILITYFHILQSASSRGPAISNALSLNGCWIMYEMNMSCRMYASYMYVHAVSSFVVMLIHKLSYLLFCYLKY